MSRSPGRIAAFALSLFCIPCAFAQAQSNWQMFGGNPQHTGQNSAETGTPPLSLAWSVALASNSPLSPAVVESGRVFVSAGVWQSSTLWARDSVDGAALWNYDFGNVFSVGHPSVVNGMVYLQQCNQTPGTNLWCFSAQTGSTVWSSPFSAQWERYWAPTVQGSSVYINGGYYGGMYGFSTSGSQTWFNDQLEQYDGWTPAVSNGVAYTLLGEAYSGGTGVFRAHSTSTGATLWSLNIPWNWVGWSMRTAPVIGGNLVYFIAPPMLYAVNPVSRTIAWSTGGTNFSGTPAYADNVVYAISGGTLQARAAASGALLWTFAGDSTLSYPPVVANGFVYAASSNNVYAVDVSSGDQAWTAAGGGWLSIGGGKLYVARSTGTLTAYTLGLDQGPPTVPVLASPADGALIQSSTPTLAWSASSDDTGVTGYQVQVSSDSQFTNLQYSVSVASNGVTTSVLPEGVHSWRIRARDTAGRYSAWSAVWTLTTDSMPPTTPALLSPANGSTRSTSAIALAWGPSVDDGTGVQDYDAQVASDAAFSAIEWSATVASPGATTSALVDGVHYWRVCARDNIGYVSSWSPVSTFVVDTVPPASTAQTGPAEGSQSTSATQLLSWTAVSDPTGVTYEVEVASDAQFTDPQYSASVASASTTTSALPEGPHTWRVRVRDGAGNLSGWSATWTLTTDSIPPTTPALLSPASGVALPTSSVPLAWGASSDAGTGVQNYDVEVASDTAFSPLEWSATQASTGVTTGALTEGLHAWRVRARDNIGSLSAWSAARTFTVDTVAPVGPVILGPVDGATSTTARPLLTWSAEGDPGATYEVEVAASSPISAPLEVSVTGLTSPEYPTLRLPDGTHFWRVRAVDGAGNVGPWSATMSFVVNSQKGFYVGLGAGGRGEIAPFQGGSAGYAARALYTLPWALYDSTVGETRPAAADLYGDGRTQLVVGLGRYPNAGGWLAVLSDSGSDFSIVRWLRVDWSRYNQANGETWPACGDIDGDGRDEVVVGVGTYTPAGGWFAMYDDGAAGFAPLGWRRVNWSQYNALDGQTRPAVGDLDGDGASEVLVGLGRYPGQGGYVYAFTSRTVAASGVLRVNWAAYNAANGETWPACGDVDGDGRDEVCLGLGAYPSNGGWMQFFDDSVTGFASLRWLRVNWAPYNAASGETRPSLGHMAGVSGHQIVVGLGPNAGANGWVVMYDRAPGFSTLGWRRVDDAAYDVSNGSTRPSVGR